MKTEPLRSYRLIRKPPQRDTAHDLFDGTLPKTQIWLNDLMSELDWENHPHKAYLLSSGAARFTRDRLTLEEAVQLGAQLPMLVRGLVTRAGRSRGSRARSATKRISSPTSKRRLKTT